jgi:hypothetical protein
LSDELRLGRVVCEEGRYRLAAGVFEPATALALLGLEAG